jgi:hypothetical protein
MFQPSLRLQSRLSSPPSDAEITAAQQQADEAAEECSRAWEAHVAKAVGPEVPIIASHLSAEKAQALQNLKAHRAAVGKPFGDTGTKLTSRMVRLANGPTGRPGGWGEH